MGRSRRAWTSSSASRDDPDTRKRPARKPLPDCSSRMPSRASGWPAGLRSGLLSLPGRPGSAWQLAGVGVAWNGSGRLGGTGGTFGPEGSTLGPEKIPIEILEVGLWAWTGERNWRRDSSGRRWPYGKRRGDLMGPSGPLPSCPVGTRGSRAGSRRGLAGGDDPNGRSDYWCGSVQAGMSGQ